MNNLTERQTRELHRIVRNAQEHFGVDIRGIDAFTYHYEEETRPGRGHRILFNYIDADHCIQGFMDVYGDCSLAIGSVNFMHDGHEECDCSLCAEENS